MKYELTNKLMKNCDIYIFVMCSDIKKNIENIKKLLKLTKLPKKMFNNFNIKETFEKRLYTDDCEILFIGTPNECNNQKLYDTFGYIGKSMKNETEKNNIKKIFIELVGNDINIIKNQVISYILGHYCFDDFKSGNGKNKDGDTGKITYFYHKNKKFNNVINNYIYEGNVQNEIRSLINTPANILNSTEYTKYIKNNINKGIDKSSNKIKVKILDETKLKKIGCNLIVGVNKGSSNKPIMIVLEYKNDNGKEKENKKQKDVVALVGKGVMFDTGGYNIKGGDFSDMKNDMTGSAVVYALFKLLAKNNVPGHFVGILPLVENMVDANATRPGDILKSYSGHTVEIVDTDAEGRLIMADALAYTKNYKPHLCIDIATLTGQVSYIFNNESSVIMGNNNKYIQEMIKCGINNNEKLWELPMWKEYKDLTKSNIADLRNYTNEASAGTIMAGAFLSNFVPYGANWIHLDIAGTDNLKNGSAIRHYGATGEILRSVFDFLQNLRK